MVGNKHWRTMQDGRLFSGCPFRYVRSVRCAKDNCSVPYVYPLWQPLPGDNRACHLCIRWFVWTDKVLSAESLYGMLFSMRKIICFLEDCRQSEGKQKNGWMWMRFIFIDSDFLKNHHMGCPCGCITQGQRLIMMDVLMPPKAKLLLCKNTQSTLRASCN